MVYTFIFALWEIFFFDIWDPLKLLWSTTKGEILNSWPLSLALKTKYRVNLFKNIVLYLMQCLLPNSSSNVLLYLSQCPRTNLNKRSLTRPKTTTAWKLIPHRSKISKNWNPPWWVPLHIFFKNLFSLMPKQLYNNYIQTHLLSKKAPTVENFNSCWWSR